MFMHTVDKMSRRHARVSLVVLFTGLSSALVMGQARPVALTPPPTLETAWGVPNLQGQWNSQTSTPLERPLDGELAWRATLTLSEAETLEGENRARFDLPPREGSVGNYNAFWRDVGKALTRTSLSIDPPEGRIPPLSREGQARMTAERAERSTRGPSNSPDTYEDLTPWTRCISRGWNGIGSWYSSNYQIFQSPGYVVVFQELIHEARIIPIDDRAPLSDKIRLWNGDPRGRWEGDTLVVETGNFLRETSFRAGSADANLRLTERFTRVSEGTLMYEATIDDPSVWSRPWTYQVPMVLNDQPVFEYACHEGNYGLYNILAGARVAEAASEREGQP